eukprot:scaffold869_cov105-Isochrysis_galbana.AAC.14
MAAGESIASADFSRAAAPRIMAWLEEERRVGLAADVLDGAEPHLVQHWLDWAVVAPLVADTRADLSMMAVAAPSLAMRAPSVDTGMPPPHDPLDLLTPYLACTESGPRRCGYIFNDGDISWHCRTCQVRHRPLPPPRPTSSPASAPPLLSPLTLSVPHPAARRMIHA